jgi:hypothetical protein
VAPVSVRRCIRLVGLIAMSVGLGLCGTCACALQQRQGPSRSRYFEVNQDTFTGRMVLGWKA